ncbi:MAG: RNA polymerase sigma factor [Spirochaetes bacterium]|nr:RNA polymerase sigma factor [Spirochaetota bacterium]
MADADIETTVPTSVEPTDQELIARYKAGDDAAADTLLGRYKDYIYRLCYRFMQNYEDAMDLMQDVLIRVLRALPRYEDRNYLKGWLYRIASNTAINMRKSNARRAFPDDTIYQTARDDKSDTAKVLEDSFVREKIHEAALKLSGKQRDVFMLRYYEMLPYAEVAKILSISANSAKSNYFYALQKMKTYLEQAGVTL